MKIKKYLILLLFIASLPFLVVTIIAYGREINFHREQILIKNLETAETISVAVDSFISNLVNTEKIIARTSVKFGDSSAESFVFNNTLQLNPEISSLALYSLDRKLIKNEGNIFALPKGNASKILSGKKFAVSNLQEIDGKFYFHVTVGVFENGNISGFVNGVVNDIEINKLVNIKIGQQGNTGVIDASGRAVTLTFAPNATWKERDRKFIPSIREALKGKPSTVDRFFDPFGDIYRLGVSVPIKDINWVANVFQPEEEVIGPVRQRAFVQAAQSFFGAVVALLLILLLANNLIEPIKALTRGTEAYKKGDFSHRVNTGYKVSEFNELADSYNAAAQAVQERFEAEKHIADELQKGLLPADIPFVEGYDIGSFYASSTELAVVGGDLYDIFHFDTNNIGLVIGDVQGHGVESALSTLTAKFLLRDLALRGVDTARTMIRINDAMVRQLESGDFITMFYSLLNIKSGRIKYSNAGHPYPFIYNPFSNSFRYLEHHNMVLGIEKGIDYSIAEINFYVGEILVLYTDGVIETRSGIELFGEKGLERVVASNADLSSSDLAQTIHQQCTRFSSGKTKDDIAILVIKRNA